MDLEVDGRVRFDIGDERIMTLLTRGPHTVCPPRQRAIVPRAPKRQKVRHAEPEAEAR